ncbi:MAG: hypothetical protein WBA74_10420 [Cyclobacteriaceae bacterium]
MEFPRTVYKMPGSKKWGKKSYDSLIVKSEEELEEALEEGFVDSFQDALFPKAKEEDKEPTKDQVIEELKKAKEEGKIESFNSRDSKADLINLLLSIEE